jgi:ArsR family transcriptional regulator, arsenate/arsenite/antimonite-responsive transcriptional repressor
MQVIEVPIEDIFQALCDRTRLRIVRLLATTQEEACLCELVDSLLEPQYKLSRHLKVLRQVGLLTAEKEGRWVYHRLVAEPKHVKMMSKLIATLPDDESIYSDDAERFNERLCHREEGRCRVGVLTKSLKSA